MSDKKKQAVIDTETIAKLDKKMARLATLTFELFALVASVKSSAANGGEDTGKLRLVNIAKSDDDLPE